MIEVMKIHITENLHNPLQVVAEYNIGDSWTEDYDMFFMTGPHLITEGLIDDAQTELDKNISTFLSEHKLKWVYSVYAIR